MSKQMRKNDRYPKELELSFKYLYDVATKLKVEPVTDENPDHQKYAAVSKNISVNGLCFVSSKMTRKGDEVEIELFLPKEKDPIHLHGEVRWCQENKDHRFETGVHIDRVEDKLVDETIYFDQEYHVAWSEFLESVLGKYRILSQNKRKKD